MSSQVLVVATLLMQFIVLTADMDIYSVIINILWESNYYILDTLKDSHKTVVIVINYPFSLEAVECERLLFC